MLGNEEIELKLIGYLLKYSYEQVAMNSIWNIADKSPKIRKFIENNLSGKGRYIYSLLPSQREVISDVLTPKKSIIVNMPTSSGKSLLAELQILFSLHNYRSNNFKPTVCYIVPTNALIEQVKRDLNEDFKDFGFNIETAFPYYEVDEIEEEILNREHIDILISTPEKLESLIRQSHPSILNTRLVIMDEATFGKYIKLAEELKSKEAISQGKYEELLLDGFRSDIVYGSNLDEEEVYD